MRFVGQPGSAETVNPTLDIPQNKLSPGQLPADRALWDTPLSGTKEGLKVAIPYLFKDDALPKLGMDNTITGLKLMRRLHVQS